jgi:kinesin family protein C1
MEDLVRPVVDSQVYAPTQLTWHRAQDSKKASALPKPASRLPQISSPPRPLAELQNGSMNARSGIPPPTTGAKHKPSSCKSLLPIYCEPERPLTQSVPEPATKVRRTLIERAGDTHSRKPTAPPSSRPLSTSVKSTVARKERGFSASTSTSRAGSRPASRSATAPSFSASMGPGAKSTRPKSAYGQYAGTHVRSKSHISTARPATSMLRRDEEDDDEEERGVPPFLISTNPGESLRAPRKTRRSPKLRPNSVSIPIQRAFHLSHSRSVSSPTFRPITPVQEEPADTDCEEVCANLEAFTLDASGLEPHNVDVGSGMPCSGDETNPFLKPLPPSRLPQATPTRQPPIQSPIRPPSSTPRITRKRYLNRFTNDYCPDFYDDRMEAMERQFSAFKEKMETDMQKATDQKESIQQLQSRGMCLCAVARLFRALSQ